MVRKIKAKLVLRLREEGFSGRQIAAQGMSRHSLDRSWRSERRVLQIGRSAF